MRRYTLILIFGGLIPGYKIFIPEFEDESSAKICGNVLQLAHPGIVLFEVKEQD